jgi:DNA-binding protein H-NS
VEIDKSFEKMVEHLNHVELQKVIEYLTERADRAFAEEQAGAAAKAREIVEKYGLTPEQVFPGARVAMRPPPGKARMKYKWGENTWTGQGFKPQWFKDALAIGVTEEQMKIKREVKE